jgi:hypothetical protein
MFVVVVITQTFAGRSLDMVAIRRFAATVK